MQSIRCFEGSAKPHEPFWRARNAVETGGEPEIEMYGLISEWSWMGDEITPKLFKQDLYKVGGGGPVTLRVNSPGGDVIAASVIRATLMDYPGAVTARIDGIAASAAVAIVLAAKHIHILDTAYMMIHDPAFSVLFAALDIETLSTMVDQLKSIKLGLVAAYTSRTGISSDRLAKMMKDETWMSSSEATTMGFADQIIEGSHVPTPPIGAGIVNALKSYSNVPAALLAGEPANKQVNPAELAVKQAQDRLRAQVKILRK
jgi:ATP-dependent Clp protease protease subunit